MKQDVKQYYSLLRAFQQTAAWCIVDNGFRIKEYGELFKEVLNLKDSQIQDKSLSSFLENKPLDKLKQAFSENTTWRGKLLFGSQESSLFRCNLMAVPMGQNGSAESMLLVLNNPEPIDTGLLEGGLNVLEAINKNLREGLYRSTADGNIVYGNDAFWNMFGYTNAESRESINSIDLYVEPTKRDELKSRLKVEGHVSNQEVLLKKKDGNIFWGLLSTSKSEDENGVIIYDGALRNITAFKEIERQLKLEKQRALEASSAKELFLSTMSHELRTPMNAVIGMTHLLLNDDPKESQVENIKTLKFSAENLLSIINDILDFSKIEAGKIELERAPFKLDELLKNIGDSFHVKAKAKGIDLSMNVGENIKGTLVGDSVRLSQILNNLISNAIKFTYHGEVQVSTELKRETKDECELFISVKDTGIGIPRNKLSSIFGLFTQANLSTTRKFGGTGLGLTITKSLIELMGGTLEVVSEPGYGSEFFFRLNLKKMKKFSDRKSGTQEPGLIRDSLKGVKILAAEDNEVNQILLKKFVILWGATISVVGNGKEAIEFLNNEDYDLILMDLQMPIMDGYTASKEIRKMEGSKFQNIPIIAVTASAMIEVKKKVLAAGMTDYISKPFSPDQLYNKIRKHLPHDHKS